MSWQHDGDNDFDDPVHLPAKRSRFLYSAEDLNAARADERAKALEEVSAAWNSACDQGDLEFFNTLLAELITASKP